MNPFKQAIKTNQRQFGCWLATADAYMAEIAATANFDWLLIDGEHAPNDLQSILLQLQAISAYDVHPVVRPVDRNVASIKQLLDIGAKNLLIPMVETPAQAEELVSAISYPPKGIRGVGAAIGRATRWNSDGDYHHHAEDDICLMIQIESVKGIENLDQILNVEDIDGVFIGPSDLAASLGHLGNTGHEEVQHTISQSVKKIHQAGKASGILSTEHNAVLNYIQQGVVFIAVGVDVLLYAQSLRDLANKYKAL